MACRGLGTSTSMLSWMLWPVRRRGSARIRLTRRPLTGWPLMLGSLLASGLLLDSLLASGLLLDSLLATGLLATGLLASGLLVDGLTSLLTRWKRSLRTIWTP
jgi:hypothetical protein